MAVMPIVLYPDQRLREPCEPVTAVDDRIRSLLSDMAETMYAAPGIGLAAPQVGLTERIIVVDLGSRDDNAPEGEVLPPSRLYKIVNPEILKKDGTIDWEEGCLSIPGIYETVKRASSITLGGLDENGDSIEIEAEGLLAVCFQHEVDHLNGVLFIDHLSRLKREMMKKKLAKLQNDQKKK